MYSGEVTSGMSFLIQYHNVLLVMCIRPSLVPYSFLISRSHYKYTCVQINYVGTVRFVNTVYCKTVLPSLKLLLKKDSNI